MTRAFARVVGPPLRAQGFTGRRGHLLRRIGPVTQVVEMQHSIYGGRVTANLGLGLEWLKPVVRWVAPPAIGPHAHDCARWIRVGLVSEAKDRWWAYGDDETSMKTALESLTYAIVQSGLPWLELNSSPSAFVEYAQTQLERSRSPRRPHGGWPELRLMTAVCAWSGQNRRAARYCAHAENVWADERARLVAARALYKARSRTGGRLPGVPRLQEELRRIVKVPRGQRPWEPRRV